MPLMEALKSYSYGENINRLIIYAFYTFQIVTIFLLSPEIKICPVSFISNAVTGFWLYKTHTVLESSIF